MEADIILITETQVMKNETAAYLLPEYLVARSVHVAHLYGEYFCKIRLAFIVTGLGGFIDVSYIPILLFFASSRDDDADVDFLFVFISI